MSGVKTEIVPEGWTRGDAIVIHTSPSPELKTREIVVITLKQPRSCTFTQPGLHFTNVAEFEAWRRWWFDVPTPPFPIDLSQEAAKQFTHEQWAKLKSTRAPFVIVQSNPPAEGWVRDAFVAPQANPFAPKNPFAQPVNNSVKNPFESKPKNPFDKA